MINSLKLMRIKTQLKSFDVNEREADIYLNALIIGPTSVMGLAKKMKMNRVTVHSAVEQLIKKGLVIESRKGKRRLIVAEEPSVLSRLLQKKFNHLNQIEKNLNFTIGLLNEYKNTDTSKPTVKAYDGVDGFKRMLEETLESKSEVVIFSYGQHLAEAVDPIYLEDYVARRAEKGICTRLLFPSCEFGDLLFSKKDLYKLEIRFLPEEYEWNAGYFLWDNKIAMLSYTAGKRTCTIIANKDLAYFFKEVVFKIAWNSVGEMCGNPLI